ncbi:hypothetical protein QWY16_11605 [Planococcus shenhongbingii]|uniref:hypothetical protein n=1 Tax=Planococcus shenhongbingii TaxID=3058398 RepID=UPI0026284E84|nr:hypothetical protein [Planococcus sp. N016]WKA57146.1 hypothetical protein QWY16_11605 [Planococcus sp. N016]
MGMPGKGDELGMFKTVEQHDLLIKGDILPRLEKVELIQSETKSEIQDVKSEVLGVETEVTTIRSAMSGIELTVLKDGAQTRALLHRFVDHYFDSDGKAFVSRETATKIKFGTKEKVWLAVIAVFASGGVTIIGNVVVAYINR